MKSVLDKADNFPTYRDIPSDLIWGDVKRCPDPQVSVIMPAYNHMDYFKEALVSALNQDYKGSYEIVVMDDNGPEAGETLIYKIVKELNAPQVFYYRNRKNIGMFGNWNRGIELARAPFLTFCHDDDMLLPNALSRLMDLQKKAGHKAVFSAFNKIDGRGNYIRKCKVGKRILGVLKKKKQFDYSFFEQFMNEIGNGVGSLFSRDCLIEIGGFDPAFYPVADYALFVHYAYCYGSIFNTVPTSNYRIADNIAFNCYKEVLEVDRHIWECMKPGISWPDFMLNRIIKAKYTTKKVRLYMEYGNADPSLKKIVSGSDKMLLRVIHSMFFFKRYGF